MCRCVMVGDREYCSQGELKRICPRGLVKLPGYEPETDEDNTCLCPIDLKATAKLNGYAYDGESDPFDVNFGKGAGE